MESLQVRERSNRTQRWSFVSRLETNGHSPHVVVLDCLVRGILPQTTELL